MLLIVLFLAVTSVFLIQYYWRRRHIYMLANKLEGPPALPILGNGLKFLGRSKDSLKVITTLTSQYAKPTRLWFGPVLVLCYTYPHHIEKILSSSKMAHKHDFYDLVKIYLGDGLISNSGENYKKHRRLIQPLINLKFATGNIDCFQRHIDILLQKMEKYVHRATFDIHDMLHACFADIIGELMLGTQINAQHGKNLEYLHATVEMYDVGYDRLLRPWYHPDIIYNLTQGKKDQDRITSVTTQFIKDAIKKCWDRAKLRSENGGEIESTTPIIDQIANIIEKDPSVINDRDFLYHMYTLYCASEDTMMIIASALCVCLGMYPEYQKIAAEEIRIIFGETPRKVTPDDIAKLQYLDMCIREVLRLMPIAPLILRKTVEDFHIDNLTIPKDCCVMISIFDVHRDPNHWENPDHFHPDHFLPETVRKRHPFAFVPFSAGPRSCIGKLLAITGLKVIMANILQTFEIEADGKFPDLVLKSDISVRSEDGYKIRLRKRVWT